MDTWGRQLVRRTRARRRTGSSGHRPGADLPGLNVAGYLRAELDVDESARRLVRALDAAGVPHAACSYSRGSGRGQNPFHGGDERIDVYDINLVCVDADALPTFRAEVGTAFFEGRYTIGLWSWEVSRFPAAFAPSFELVDEVWVASDFARDAIAAATTKPVLAVPLPIEPIEPRVVSRPGIGLPDGFLFAFTFDYRSVFERMNPLGLIEAFAGAFTPNEGPVLVLETINADADPTSSARLEERARERPDVLVLDGDVSAEQRGDLLAACDCYVSLHRSEGYGLTIAEAIALAKPVIATGYSGNLAFMDESNGYLVPYELTAVPRGCEPYPAGAVWAEPDVEAAAQLMRMVWSRPEDARARAARGRADLARRNSPTAVGSVLAARLESVRSAGRLHATTAPGHALAGPAPPPARIARRLLRRLLWPELVDRKAHDEAVATSIADLQRALDSLRSELDLSPPPYLADRTLVETCDDRGEAMLGYEDGARASTAPYRLFEDVFRGSETFIRERQRVYLPLLVDHAPVLDAGCGRGELLELLREAGVEAKGVDSDPGMVERCREKGLDVELGDLTSFLGAADEGSLGAVFAGQVIEHLRYEDLMMFFALAKRALRPGGLFVAETVNPHSFPAFKMFWIDPTHRRPIYPEVAVTLCRIHGYGSARVVFPHGIRDLERDRRVEGEYAVVAVKSLDPG